MRTAWLLKPHGQTLYEAVPLAGFYLMGMYWPAILREAGLFKGKSDNFSKLAERLEKEFGRTSKKDLMKGTVPIPKRRKRKAAIGVLPERSMTMQPGAQWDADVDGTLLQVFFTRHFVERFYFDFDSREAVARSVDEDTVNRVIGESLPRIKDLIEHEGIAEGILVSDQHGLSMKFFTVPMRDGWRLDFATMIAGAPLWRTSPREVMVKVNPVVPVIFDREIPEDLQTAVIAEISPDLLDFEIGDVEHLGGEIARAIVERTDEGFEITDAEWAGEWEPIAA